MGAVAKRAVPGMFAAAPGHVAGLLDLNFLGLEPRPFVRPVAKRLRLRAATGTPIIDPRLDILNKRFSLTNDRFAHEWILPSPPAAGQVIALIGSYLICE